MTATSVPVATPPAGAAGRARATPAPSRWRAEWAATDGRTQTALLVLLVGGSIFLVSAASHVMMPGGAQTVAWWPAAGISVGAVAMTAGRRRHVLIVAIGLSALIGSLAGGISLPLALVFAVADVSEAWVAGGWLSRGRLLKLQTLRDLGYMTLVALSAGVLAGSVALAGVGLVDGHDNLSAWGVAVAAHTTGILVVVPLGIRRPALLLKTRRAERVVQWIATVSVAVLVFGPNGWLPLPFLVLMMLVWTSLRQGGRTAAAQLLVIGFLASVLTAHSRGPFAQAQPTIRQVVLLQIFLLACTMIVLVVSLTAAQREAAVALVSSNERFLNALVETMDVGIVVVDSAGTPTLLNRTFREMYGALNPKRGDWRAVAQTTGLFGADGVSPLTAREVPMARVLAGEQFQGVEIVIAPDGLPRRNLVVNGRQIRTEDGTLLGGVNALHDVTALKRHEIQLKDALDTLAEEREFERAVVEVVNAGVLACDAAGIVRVRNGAQRRLMGDGGSESLQSALRGAVITDLPGQVGAPGAGRHDVLITARQVKAPDGRLLGAVAAFTDVTAEKLIEAQLRESIAFHDALLAASPDVTYISDAVSNIPTWVSHAVTSTLGFTEAELRAMGKDVLTDLIHPADLSRMVATNDTVLKLADGQAVETRFRIKTKAGFYLWVSRRVTPFTRYKDGRLRQILSVGRDITDTVTIEDRLTSAALHDPLTGLPNRRLLADRLDLALKRAARTGGEVAVLFCDLDGFKRVNDSAGHAAGDVVLTATAARLTSAVRPQDTVARVGGDEFVIVVDLNPPDAPDPLITPAAEVPAEPSALDGFALDRSALDRSADPSAAERSAAADPSADPSTAGRRQARAVARRITAALSQPMEIDGAEYVVTVSIGITFARAGDDPDGALRDADSAMYLAKTRGKHRTEIFNDTLRSDASERSRIEQVLRTAIADIGHGPSGTGPPSRPSGTSGTCVLSAAYQPIVDLRSRQIVGVEALARLHDDSGVAIEPSVFIPIAEESGLILQLGNYMLETACRDLAHWHAAHPSWPNLGVAVNLSAREAGQADLVSNVRVALARNGLRGANLTLELTESILLQAGTSTLNALHELRALGVRIDIDDFGTGYGTLRYLLEFPVTGLKIDRSFVTGLPDEPTSRTIVRAIAGMARDLDLSCVAEGIETPTQLSALPKGVAGQGYLLGRPVPAAEIDARLRLCTPPSTPDLVGWPSLDVPAAET